MSTCNRHIYQDFSRYVIRIKVVVYNYLVKANYPCEVTVFTIEKKIILIFQINALTKKIILLIFQINALSAFSIVFQVSH